MRLLAWWFRIVGLVYMALGVTFIPLLNTGRVDGLVPGFDAARGGPAWNGFVDFTFMFGLEEIVLGAFLVFASFRPRWWESLVWLLVALSVVRGVGHDVYMIASAYSPGSYVAFAAFHLVLITTGVLFLRRWQRRARRAPATPAASARSDAATSR
ncbi:hypothetical protein DEA06_11040 [Microbacterium sp. Gd 4-13]|uniref:BphX family protein n=1 Tax=Microbacterium sp. Gd 4-13 TaxID=2173179 RepID=UPI000D56E915|nr:BphX family protein [Microbacterium sp. Gd 4-13]PVW03897.1 hypothetical protein DEA06_11040 [Microbacterium sp. Gd 4-13]